MARINTDYFKMPAGRPIGCGELPEVKQSRDGKYKMEFRGYSNGKLVSFKEWLFDLKPAVRRNKQKILNVARRRWHS